jgi:hypothetical protein
MRLSSVLRTHRGQLLAPVPAWDSLGQLQGARVVGWLQFTYVYPMAHITDNDLLLCIKMAAKHDNDDLLARLITQTETVTDVKRPSQPLVEVEQQCIPLNRLVLHDPLTRQDVKAVIESELAKKAKGSLVKTHELMEWLTEKYSVDTRPESDGRERYRRHVSVALGELVGVGRLLRGTAVKKGGTGNQSYVIL